MGWQTQVAIQLQAGNTIINATGVLTYSGPPAAGNLSASEAPASGTDQFGNNFLAGVCSYGATIATQMGSGFITFYTGSLAGGWSSKGTIATDSLGDILISAAAGRQVITLNNTLDDGSGGATFGGTVAVAALTVGGSSNTGSAGLPDGTINGTSGGASAGTAHTHGPGSFAVTNGVHQHAL